MHSGSDLICRPSDIQRIRKGRVLLYNDLFTIYPYENQLFVVKMTGEQIKNYLEYSYDMWINTISSPKEHLLKIRQAGDPRTGQARWSFVNASYNFDSLCRTQLSGRCHQTIR